MSDQQQILRLLATIREEVADIRSRQEELYEILISYKDQINDLKGTVVDKLQGLPKSPYIAGQLVPAPSKVDGVEDFQVLYGEDIDASGVANYYVPANQIADMNRVISIRFAAVVRSAQDNLTGGVAQNFTVLGTVVVAPDTRLRQVYTSTVNVRNRL